VPAATNCAMATIMRTLINRIQLQGHTKFTVSYHNVKLHDLRM